MSSDSVEPSSGHRRGVMFLLSVMMFLEFFIWGAWFELNFGYVDKGLGFGALEQSLVFGAFNLAALLALFVGTQFVDRNFAAERFLAFSQFVGGLAMFGLFWVPSGWTMAVGQTTIDATFWVFFLLMLVHCLFYVPTISITNSIAFANLTNPQRDFGMVRVWGTIGWIVASWPFIFILVDWNKVPEFGTVPFTEWLGTALGTGKTGEHFRHASRYIFLVAGTASLVMAAFSLFLPHTPPKPASASSERFAWLEAMRLLRYPFVFVLFIVTFLDAGVHQTFFIWTERFLTGAVGIPSNWATPVMKIGQVAEIITMIFLGYVLKRLGWRITMVVGILGHAARFAVFAYYPEPWAAVAINAVHGICYAFFFATVYIFVDEFFPKDARSSAQGLFNVLILGVGPFVANVVSPMLGEYYQQGDTFNFREIFRYPLLTALAAALMLLLFFHPPRKSEDMAS